MVEIFLHLLNYCKLAYFYGISVVNEGKLCIFAPESVRMY